MAALAVSPLTPAAAALGQAYFPVLRWDAVPVPAPNANLISAADSNKLMAVDGQGNVYTTGQGTDAFGETGIMTWRFDHTTGAVSAGWPRFYRAQEEGAYYGTAIALVSPGSDPLFHELIVTGVAPGDLGTGSDYVTIKYRGDGAEVWQSRYNNPQQNGDDKPVDVVATGSGGTLSVYVTGTSEGVGTSKDYATVKYNGVSGGVSSTWADVGAGVGVRRYNHIANKVDAAADMDVGEVSQEGGGLPIPALYVTGTSFGAGNDYATLAYALNNGDLLWLRRYEGIGDDTATSIVYSAYQDDVPLHGSVFVTGSSYNPTGGTIDYATVRYLDTGVPKWGGVPVFHNGQGNAKDVARKVDAKLDREGRLRVHVTGESWGGFDRGYDYATLAYEAATGVEEWRARYNREFVNGEDRASDLVANDDGDVYVTGRSFNGVNLDYVTLRYRSDWMRGTVDPAPEWTTAYVGTHNLNDTASAVRLEQGLPQNAALDPDVYVNGRVARNGTTEDYGTLRYKQCQVGVPCND